MNDWQDPETPIYNELMRQRETKPSETPIYDQLLAEYQANNKLLEEDEVNKMQQAVQEFQEAIGGTVNEAPRIPSAADMDDSISTLSAELSREDGLIDSIQKQNIIGVAGGLAEVAYELFTTAVVFGIDLQPIFDEVHKAAMARAKGETYEPQIGVELNKQTTYGHEDTTVYKTKEIPITLGIGGPKIGQGKIVMEHNGEVMMEGVMDDVSILPVMDHLGFSVSGLSIGPDAPEGEGRIATVFPESEEPIENVNMAKIKADGGPVGSVFPLPLSNVVQELKVENQNLGRRFKASLGFQADPETMHISATGPIEQNSFEVVFPPYDR